MSCEFPDDPRFVLARSVIVDAGALAAAYFADLGALGVEHKLNGQDVVSIADRAVEELIRGRIIAAFPDDGFLGEETGLSHGSSGFVWVVDPIDGTSCFVHGLRDWCISIALTRGESTEFGLVQYVAEDELFVAARGQGAFMNGAPIHVDATGTIATGLVGLGANLRVPAGGIAAFAHGLLGAGGMFFRNGSGALMLTYVACGRLIAYYEAHINSWDCLAALCLIREAGGWTAPFPQGTNLLAGGPVIAAAPQIHEQLLALVGAAPWSAGRMMKLIHITDPHLPLPGVTLFGLDPYARLDACLAHINAHHADAELVVISGDLTHDGDPAAYAVLAERLAGLIPPSRLLVGNHDDRAAFFTAFPTIAPANGFAQGIDMPQGRVILLDTLRSGHVEGELCDARLDWLDGALAGANGAPCFIFMHHPPFAIHLPALDEVGLTNADAFHARLARYGNVRHIFAGHVHRPTSGTWRGFAFTTLPGTSHQSAAIFSENRFGTTLEPPAYGVVLIDAASVVVHTINFLEQGIVQADH